MKIKWKKWVVAISILLLLFVIGFFTLGINDYDLGDSYYYLPKYESIDIGYPEAEAIIYKSAKKNLFTDVKIRGDVISVSSNKDLILASQHPTNIHGIDTVRYFIIRKEMDAVYGPYKKEEYLLMRKQLRIPQELKLKEE
jgi:hypothetical protein